MNINDSYFDGYYKDIWKTIIPAELTRREVDFILDYFNLQPGDRVLDMLCGYGRHAIALSEKGMAVTAVDNLEEYITELNAEAQEKSLPIKTVQVNISQYQPEEVFDLAICMGNSLNFFNATDAVSLLKMVSTNLNPGGHLLINT